MIKLIIVIMISIIICGCESGSETNETNTANTTITILNSDAEVNIGNTYNDYINDITNEVNGLIDEEDI